MYYLVFFTIFGAPSIIQSDKGKEFGNKIVQEVCEVKNFILSIKSQ